jgi:HAD superfamily hydrolase (TIGR01509 family)
MSRVFRAVVFDFDGLILDTETPIWKAWNALFAEYDAELTLDEWSREVGAQHAIDPWALLRERGNAEFDQDELNRRRQRHRNELMALETVRPGVVDWLADASSLGLATAIASSSEIEWVEPHLTRLGLRDHFAHVSCWGPDVAAKPAPDTYLAACAALGVAPAAAVAIEDSPNGVAAAYAAGLRVVAVPNDVTRTMDLSLADLVLDSLADRTLASVLREFGS